MITDWEKMEVGKFYKLRCGCEGQVIRMDTEPGQVQDRGFYMAYSIMGCRDQSTHEKSYREGYGPYCNYFNYSLNDEAMPAREIEKPAWWDEAVGERIQKLKDRGAA